MANRYWVGGTASWDGTAGSKWALTSGGAGGQAVPTSADDVFFDAASGAVTCTISAGNTGAKSITCTGFTGTLTGGTAINVAGSVTLVTGMTFSFTAGLTLSGTGTLTSAGKTFSGGGITIDGVGATVTLGDAVSTAFNLVVTNGTFTTNNFNVTAAALSSSNANTRAINLGSSTVTLTSATGIACSTNTGLTFNAGTSSIIFPAGAGGTINFGTTGATLYNTSFTGGVAGATISILGPNTYNNFAVTGPSSVGNIPVIFDSRQTINGALSTTGTAGNRRVWFRSATYGIAQTLTINSAASLTDADFRDLYVIGTAAPISGTRIGNLRGCSGITFDVAKTVYWVTLAGGNWSGTNWSNTSGGTANDQYFPLAQDTATIVNTGLNTSATVTIDSIFTNISGIDMSARTNAMTLSASISPTCYGNLTFGSGVTYNANLGTLTFSGRNTQTITSAGKTIGDITVDSYGGTVQLADALNIGSRTLTVTNGTFDTKGYAVSAGTLSSSNSNVRAINLGASTVTLSGNAGVSMFTSTNLTFNAGTSTIVLSGTSAILDGGSKTYSTVNFTTTAITTISISGTNTFANLSFTATAVAGLSPILFYNNQTITGTLTCAGASAVRRIFLRSDTLGTTRTLTVNTLSATDCDFRDITIAGTAAGSSPTRASDCGGNTGITFPAAKTVYWNLAGAQNWSATAWCPSSGGTPDINQFPLAQDTAVFDNTGSVTGTITQDAAWNIGTFDASARTSAMTIDFGSNAPFVYGDWKFGTGVTHSSSAAVLSFAKRGTQTITCNGVAFGCQVNVDNVTGIVQISDTFKTIVGRVLALASGTFDAGTNNVEISNFSTNYTTNRTLKMGSGTWTLSTTGTVWFINASNLTFYKSTANIVLSDISTSARTFSGGDLSYNKLTIGGTTGTSTTTISGNNQFTELASTKTVAHTIDFGANTPTFGAWTVSGTAGNVVTIAGASTITIAGARVSGVDYLALGTTTISATSPGEFYAGANSTGGTNAILTAAPAAVTRYWVGGTGTWDATTTTNWSATSGGAGGASVPTSADAVVFDSASNATAYTVTLTATQLRCGALTMAGPLSGNVTWAGSAPLAIHNNVSLSATGITRSYTGAIYLSGSTTGKTFTTNGTSFSNDLILNGVGSAWSLGSALTVSGNVQLINGSFSTANYACSVGRFYVSGSPVGNAVTLNLGSSTATEATIGFTILGTQTGFTLNAGTSTINNTWTGAAVIANPSPITLAFYNYNFTGANPSGITISGTNTFNNLSFAGRTSSGISNITFSGNQTINGTLTLSAGTDATMRTFVQSDTLGAPRTLTVNAFSGTDADFRDIAVTGTAAPISGTRLGNCAGNSGITFGAGVNKYWNLAGNNNWNATAWATSAGGAVAANNFPLAQDTAIITSTSPASGSIITLSGIYNYGTIDMSARTSNTLTLTVTSSPNVHGNWINGTGTTISGSSTITFFGRTAQTITSAGKVFTNPININSPGGTVSLQDAFVTSANSASALNIQFGTFNANNFNVTLSGATATVGSSFSNVRTIAIGSGTWTIAGSGTAWTTSTSTNLTVTGTGTISLTSASAKTFAGGNFSYSGITLDQGGAGALTITGNNTFGNITNSYSATGATNITLGTTTQTVGAFTATGAAGRVLTVQGTSATSPATLVYTGVSTIKNSDYLTITGVRAYSLSNTWYAGNNSTNNGSLGWIFAAAVALATGNFLMFFN